MNLKFLYRCFFLFNLLTICQIGCFGQIYKLVDVNIEASSGFESIAVSPDKKYLVSGHLNGMICIWTLPELKLIKRLDVHTKTINSVIFDLNGDHFTSAGEDNQVVRWTCPGFEMDVAYTTPVESNSFACYSALNSSIYYGGYNIDYGNDYNTMSDDGLANGDLLKISPRSSVSKVVYHHDKSTSSITDGNISADGNTLYFTKDKYFFVYNLVKDSVETIVRTEYYLNNFTVSKDIIFIWGANNLLKLTKNDSRYSYKEVVGSLNTESGYSRIAVAGMNNLIVTGDYYNEVVLWDPEKLTVKQILFGHSNKVRAFEFLRNDSILITAGYDGRMLIWSCTGDSMDNLRNNKDDAVYSESMIPTAYKCKSVELKETSSVNSSELMVSFKTNFVKDTITFLMNNKIVYQGIPNGDNTVSLKINPKSDNNWLVFFCEVNKVDEFKKLNLSYNIGGKTKTIVLRCTRFSCDAVNFIMHN